MKSVKHISVLMMSLMVAVSFVGCTDGEIMAPGLPDKGDCNDKNQDIKDIPIKNKRPDLGPIRPRVDFYIRSDYNLYNTLVLRFSEVVTSAELHLQNIVTGDCVVLKGGAGSGEICCQVERGVEYLLSVFVDGDIYEEVIFVE